MWGIKMPVQKRFNHAQPEKASLNVFLISSQKVFFRYELEISLAQKAEYVHDVVGYLSARREYLWQTKRRIDGI